LKISTEDFFFKVHIRKGDEFGSKESNFFLKDLKIEEFFVAED